MPRSRRIVLTGGPCAGKTTITQVLEKAFAEQVVIVPEAASLLFRGGFPRWGDTLAAEALQRAIYRVQVENEVAHAAHFPGRALVMDRGTLDGAAYWPAGPEAFFRSVGSSLETELARYDLVIYLESAGREAFEQHHLRNPARTETWEEAAALDAATRAQWERHARLVVVHNNTSFSAKIAAVLTAVESELESR
jgi:predicted ATPase